MKYEVVARFYDTQEVHDSVIVDDYQEACELAVNWQTYYDEDFLDDREVVVAVYEIEERSLLDG